MFCDLEQVLNETSFFSTEAVSRHWEAYTSQHLLSLRVMLVVRHKYLGPLWAVNLNQAFHLMCRGSSSNVPHHRRRTGSRSLHTQSVSISSMAA